MSNGDPWPGLPALRHSFEIPDDCVYIGGIAVCQFMDADGEVHFGYRYDTADMPLSTSLGILEIAKLSLYDRSVEPTEEDDP